MLYSQGVRLEDLGTPTRDGTAVETDPRRIWQRFAVHYHLFRGTPTRLWLDHTFATLFGLEERLSAATAEHYYDVISEHLSRPEFRPRALFERFNIEVIATTDSPLDDLGHHRSIGQSGWRGRVIPAYRPDAVVDPDAEGFRANLERLGELTGCDTGTWRGYLEAHRQRRAFFKEMGATATDHGHPNARTADLDPAAAERLFRTVAAGEATTADADLFRAQMLTEMAAMSVEDGLVLQIHPGSARNHNPALFARFGRDKGADIPTPTDYVQALKPLLDRFGNSRDLRVILFTLDETTYGRELAPLAGHYPCLRLGPPWWFFDSAEGMRRFRELTTETAGFYNTVGFNDDTRAFLSIPARHDTAGGSTAPSWPSRSSATGWTRTRPSSWPTTSPTALPRRPTSSERSRPSERCQSATSSSVVGRPRLSGPPESRATPPRRPSTPWRGLLQRIDERPPTAGGSA